MSLIGQVFIQLYQCISKITTIMENKEVLINDEKNLRRKQRRKYIFKRGSLGFVLGLILSIVVLNTTYGILQLIGFGSFGIVSRSWAANYEAKYHGTVAKDSWFAGM